MCTCIHVCMYTYYIYDIYLYEYSCVCKYVCTHYAECDAVEELYITYTCSITYIHTYTYVFLCIYPNTSRCVCTYIHMSVSMYMRAQCSVLMQSNSSTLCIFNIYIYMYVCAYVYYMYICIYIFACVHICTHNAEW